jgi:DNA repair protein RadC
MPNTTMRLRELTVRYTVAKDSHGLPVAIDSAIISTPHAAASAFLPLFQDEPAEVFGVLCLSANHRAIAYREVFRGSVNEVTVQPREIFQTALLANAVALIVGHCHPSGDPAPSPEDVAVTKRLIQAGELIGIELLDHIITGDGRYSSFRESGRLRT